MPGLPKDIIKKYGVSKKAWAVFRARHHRTPIKKLIRVRRSRSTRPSMARRRIRRRRYRFPRFRRRHSKQPIPILPIVGGVVAPMVSAFSDAGVMEKIQANQPLEAVKAMINEVSLRYAGYQPFVGYQTQIGFRFDKMLPTYGGLIMGIVGHMIAQKAGVNKYMARVPLIGKYVRL